ncbi:MAG TPA: hypothetical protein VNK91_00655 [Burkholderiaceae bacterium]|jgi:hypothetical protein|nr:hypothetical protein [Burkholderiaceae bacterium]
MKWKRFALTVLVVFVAALAWNGFVHGVLLKDANLALVAFARPAAERSAPLGLALTGGLAALFVYSYAAFVRTPGVLRALGHGLFFALLAGLLVDLNQYLLYPLPASLAALWFAAGTVEFCLYALLAAWLYPIAVLPVRDAP